MGPLKLFLSFFFQTGHRMFAVTTYYDGQNGRKLPKWVENNVGKGEIARYEQFLLFPQCFEKSCTSDTEKPGLVWERVKVP